MFAAIIGQLFLGWLLADLATGIFHWWEDRFGRVEWPVIGQWLIVPNRLHHTDPLAFTRHGFWHRNCASIVAAAVLATLLALLFGPAPWVIAVAFGGALSNEVHHYAHQPSRAPRWLRVLQQTGAIQSPREHGRHHRRPHETNYCVLTDWLNPLLEAANVWPRLEKLVGRRA